MVGTVVAAEVLTGGIVTAGPVVVMMIPTMIRIMMMGAITMADRRL